MVKGINTLPGLFCNNWYFNKTNKDKPKTTNLKFWKNPNAPLKLSPSIKVSKNIPIKKNNRSLLLIRSRMPTSIAEEAIIPPINPAKSTKRI
jgi:hypothetical protein